MYSSLIQVQLKIAMIRAEKLLQTLNLVSSCIGKTGAE